MTGIDTGVKRASVALRQDDALDMKQAAEYRQHAHECRALARAMTDDEHRAQLLRMAETWERLAEEREGREARQPALIADPDDAKGG